jgi:hypothetical protein
MVLVRRKPGFERLWVLRRRVWLELVVFRVGRHHVAADLVADVEQAGLDEAGMGQTGMDPAELEPTDLEQQAKLESAELEPAELEPAELEPDPADLHSHQDSNSNLQQDPHQNPR